MIPTDYFSGDPVTVCPAGRLSLRAIFAPAVFGSTKKLTAKDAKDAKDAKGRQRTLARESREWTRIDINNSFHHSQIRVIRGQLSPHFLGVLGGSSKRLGSSLGAKP
jgi:hypothetical protein